MHEKNSGSDVAEKNAHAQIVRFAQLGLRLLGILLLVDGSAGLLGSFAFQLFFNPDIDYASDVSKAARWNHNVTYGIYVFSGLYFVMDGDWVIRKIFVPTVREDNE